MPQNKLFSYEDIKDFCRFMLTRINTQLPTVSSGICESYIDKLIIAHVDNWLSEKERDKNVN